MDEHMDSHLEAQILSTSDVNSGDWHIGIDKQDRWKAALTNHFRLF